MTSLTGKTQLLGVIGHPVEHSLSPLMQNAALAALGLDWVYLPFPVAPGELADAVKGLKVLGVKGFNVTLPHKQAVMPLLAEVSPLARQVGAVNTVLPFDSQWRGTNTDVEGFLAPLLERQKNWAQCRPVILGNGGAARAVVVALAQLGCPTIAAVGRDLAKLEAFHRGWRGLDLSAAVTVHPWEHLPLLLPQTRLLINTTPVGMAPKGDVSPLKLEELAFLSSQALVYDLIYTPRPTRLLREAESLGFPTQDGLEMLARQGAAALGLWLNREEVPVAVMRRALESHFDPPRLSEG
ncbi:MAG: shikimate dehydrogenase [Cyanobacteria bacterium RI_101]|nr:shikimate dehydrogenase [Cyanobacteria bacterium RI_101]